jgi:hypothetical protein
MNASQVYRDVFLNWIEKFHGEDARRIAANLLLCRMSPDLIGLCLSEDTDTLFDSFEFREKPMDESDYGQFLTWNIRKRRGKDYE